MTLESVATLIGLVLLIGTNGITIVLFLSKKEAKGMVLESRLQQVEKAIEDLAEVISEFKNAVWKQINEQKDEHKDFVRGLERSMGKIEALQGQINDIKFVKK